MEEFSLEEEEGNALFLTQEPSQIQGQIQDNSDGNDDLFCGVQVGDFQSPVKSLCEGVRNVMYSDISDEEMDFEEENGL